MSAGTEQTTLDDLPTDGGDGQQDDQWSCPFCPATVHVQNRVRHLQHDCPRDEDGDAHA